MTETNEWKFLSNAAPARQPEHQPETRSAYATHIRYRVPGSIYYKQKNEIPSPKMLP